MITLVMLIRFFPQSWPAAVAFIAPLLAALAPALITVAGDVAWRHHLGVWLDGAMLQFDFILVFYLGGAFLAWQRRAWIGGLVASILATALYAAAWSKYDILGEEPRFSDFFLLPDLFHYYGWLWILPVVLFMSGVLALLIANGQRRPILGPLLLLPLLAYLLVLGGKAWAPDFTRHFVPPMAISHRWHPHALAVGQYMALAIDALVHYDRRDQIRRLQDEPDPAPVPDFFVTPLPAAPPRNIHIVLVESLTDPQRLAKVQLTADPLPPLFQLWRHQSGTHALAPVHGYRSPDAEFEVLCGLPAILDRNQVIFAELRTPEIACLPRKLAQLGWITQSSVPVVPWLFRADSSFIRFGFARRFFAPDTDMSDRDGAALSAESLLQQGYARARNAGAEGQPVLNYIFLTSGHYPFDLDESKRPLRFGVTPPDDLLARYVNTVHYNTHAVATYVAAVQMDDPDALILVVGDHTPPLGRHARFADASPQRQYEVPLLLLDGRRGLVALPPRLPTYYLPWLLLDTLTGGAFCPTAVACPHHAQNMLRPVQGGVFHLLATSDTGTFCPDNGHEDSTDDRPTCRAAWAAARSFKRHLFELIKPKTAPP